MESALTITKTADTNHYCSSILVSLLVMHDLVEHHREEPPRRNTCVSLRLLPVSPRLLLQYMPLRQAGALETLSSVQGVRAAAGPPLYLDQQLRGAEQLHLV